MAFDGDNLAEHLTTEQLLLQILRELRLLNLMFKEMTGYEVDMGDLDE